MLDISKFTTTNLEGMLARAKSVWDKPELIELDFGLCYNLFSVEEELVYRGYDLVEAVGLVWINRKPLSAPCDPVPELEGVARWDNPYRWDLLHFVIKSLEAELEIRAGSLNSTATG